MALALGRRDSSLKYRCQALENLHDKVKNARHAERSKARRPGVCMILLREKLVILMML